jgi:hypothetical protein
MPCPICQTSPTHLRYRCPTVSAGSGAIRKRIAELQQDETVDHSQLIQELRGLAEKTKKTSGTNTHSPILRPHAQIGGESNPSVDIPGHGLGAASGTSPKNDSSGPSTPRAVLPRPAILSIDAELDAIIRGPGGPPRLTVDDIVFDDEDTESVVLENDEEEDLNFRRLSRKMDVTVSSEEEQDDDDDGNSETDKAAEAKHLPSVRAPSSTRSATVPFMAIHGRQSTDIDGVDDTAVDDAMASDGVIFSVETPAFTDGVKMADPTTRSTSPTPTPLTPTGSPRREQKISSNVLRPQTPKITTDDPIQPAEGFPPTPVQPHKAAQSGTLLTPRMTQRMKDRNGKVPVRLSQLDPPFSLIPNTRTTPPKGTQDDVLEASQVDQEAIPPRARTRSSTRVLTVAPASSAPPLGLQQPAKRRRAPNKTPEQREQEAAAKLAAKQEKERLRKEKADAKLKGKKSGVKKSEDQDRVDCLPPSDSTPLPNSPDSAPLDSTPVPPRLTPLSQDEWTILKSTSPHEDEYRDHESMRDELRSSSEVLHDGDQEEEAPLFLPAESQVPFPYSQWNSIPEDHGSGSPKDSDDEEEEEEVAASMKSSQRPGSYRRLTDIASQPSLFSTPALRGAAFPPATFPRAKGKRHELYGALPQEDDDSTDSDSSAADAPSHIPKSRRAGTKVH